jgi:predicted NAD/FAD-binding protein
MRIAEIGAGNSGNIVARLLALGNDVHVFEAAAYVGGHTNTIDFQLDGRDYSADTGFMVFNRSTYPNFCRMLALLGIDSQPSDMSFSVRCDRSGWEYQGSSLNGLFAQRRNLVRPAFWRMLWEIARFNHQATRLVEDNGQMDATASVGDFLRENGYGDAFIDSYLMPMASAIWSTRPDRVLEFPLVFLLAFFRNHGLLQLRDRPEWLTIPGGARRYVDALVRPIQDRVRLNCPVRRVGRVAGRVMVETDDGFIESFDHVVFATHADQTLKLLADADQTERRVLSAFEYQRSEAMLHLDWSLLPRHHRAWASWNYHVGDEATAGVTYDLRRLQRLDVPVPLLLTLNDAGRVHPGKVLRRFQYSHPAYNAESLAAQQLHSVISGRNRVHFCGAYWGYGFHEDGVNSALAVANCFGRTLDELKDPQPCEAVSMKAVSPMNVATP